MWLHPADAAQLIPGQAAATDPNRFVVAQIDIIQSDAVARQAAMSLAGMSIRYIERHLSVTGDPGSDVVTITATDSRAEGARELADAVAKGYIENRRQRAVADLQQASQDVADRIAALQATITDLDSKIASLKGDAPARDAATAARDAAASEYQALYARQQTLAADLSLERGGAEIIAPAKTPLRPSSPHPITAAILGGLVGLALSAGVVVLREHLDDRVRSPVEVGRALGLPILGELPYDKDMTEGAAGVATLARPQSALSESVRSLRTRIDLMSIDQPAKVIVVTSAVPGEGKSVVSANLAAAWAQAGRRTVLVGADLRKPGVSKLFALGSDEPGLTDVLWHGSDATALAWDNHGDGGYRRGLSEASANLDELLVSPMRNLLLLPSGAIPPNPAELLGTSRMRRLIEQIRDQSDIVVIDTPPLLPVTDAAIMASLADLTILVSAISDTPIHASQKAKSILESTKANLVGLVINKVPRSIASYAYTEYYPDARHSTNGSPTGSKTRGRRSVSP